MYVWVGARLAVEILICSAEPSAAVAEPYISGIKSNTVLHVSRSSCTLACGYSYTSFGRCTLIQSQQKQMTHSVKHKVQMHTYEWVRTFKIAGAGNVGHCHFPCCSDCKMTLDCLLLKAAITILLRHVIILMLSMEMNWLTIDLQ